MSNLSPETVRKAISDHPDPETGRGLDSMGQIKEIVVDQGNAALTLGLTSHSAPIADELSDALESKIVAAAPGSTVTITYVDHPRPPARIGQIALKAKRINHCNLVCLIYQMVHGLSVRT